MIYSLCTLTKAVHQIVHKGPAVQPPHAVHNKGPAQQGVERIRGKVERLKDGQTLHQALVILFGHSGVRMEEGGVVGHAAESG